MSEWALGLLSKLYVTPQVVLVVRVRLVDLGEM